MADQIHQISRILAVMDREGRVHADLLGILPQQPRTDGVERPRPGQRVLRQRSGLVAQHGFTDALDTPCHLNTGTPGEGQQQDASRISPRGDQMRHPMRKRVGLARSGASDDQQRG